MTDGSSETLARTARAVRTNVFSQLSVIRHSPHTREVKSAMKKLREDINGCPELVVALEQTRWNRNRNSYTARQVRLIAEYLCID